MMDLSEIWINNIKRLDGKSKLKHGEFYARDGSVHDLEFDENKVKAKVDGAPGDVFDCEITFAPLSAMNKKTIMDCIFENPAVYSKITSNIVPDELFKLGVDLFPKTCDDFEMKCSCDKGGFCKHTAALFHKIALEINRNPFLVFSLRGLDLIAQIQSEKVLIPTVEDILKRDTIAVLNNSNETDYLNKLRMMLADYPSFYSSSHENFTKILCNTLESMSQCIEQIQNPGGPGSFHEYIILGHGNSIDYFSEKSSEGVKKLFESKWLNPQNWSQYRLNIDSDYDIDNISFGDSKIEFITSDLKYVFFAFFAEISQIQFYDYCDDINYLYEIYQFTAWLIYRSALIPEFFALENDYYHVRWVPDYDVSIFFKLKKLYDRCPQNLLTFNGEPLTAQNQVNTIISLFFEGFCKYYLNKFIPRKLAMFANEKYFKLFFSGTQDLSGFNYEGKELEISNWISTLYLKQKKYNLSLNIIQHDFDFWIDLKIDMEGIELSIGEVLQSKKSEIIRDISMIENVFNKFEFEYDLNRPRLLNLKEYSFFEDKIAPVLSNMGVIINFPVEFDQIKKAKLILDANIKAPEASFTLDDLVDFDWKVAIGDEYISVEEFKSLSKNFRGLIRLNNEYINVSDEDLIRISREISRIPQDRSKSSLLQYLLTSDEEEVEIDSKLNNLLDKVLNVNEAEIPDSLSGDLRQYQETGFSWMLQNIQLGFGSILADDMGLGKTIQLLTTVLYLKENAMLDDGRVLVVAPTSILTNWMKEIEKFTPSLKAVVYHGQNRHFPEDDFDILLTSYGVVRRDYDELNAHKWFLIAVDEAQNIKNPNAKQTKAIKSIDASNHIALSGTPIENHLSEYWSIFDFINQGYLYSLKNFRERFINPIEKDFNGNVLSDFKKITSPFILRRLKTDKDIIRDLPDKIVNDVYCNLTVKQAGMYEETLNQMIRDVESSEGIQRKGLVLKLITALKQICNHPAQFSKSDRYKISESGKMEVLMNILDNIVSSGEKVLIFTQYVQMGHILKDLIEEKFKTQAMFLHGGVSRKKRDEMVDEFQNGDRQIFILSLKAGGIGLNLTAAYNVIHYDLWWNPAVENQATDRAYRIGQSENVMVYRFITSGTLEERINQVLVEKRQLVEMTIEGSESFITEMTNEELKEMLNLRNEG